MLIICRSKNSWNIRNSEKHVFYRIICIELPKITNKCDLREFTRKIAKLACILPIRKNFDEIALNIQYPAKLKIFGEIYSK